MKIIGSNYSISIKERYKNLNESFDSSLIFHLGIDAGFFSEFTYMIHAMLFCLENHLQFKLYSKDANFGYSRGWSDYFEPFCEEIEDDIHHKWNVHRIPGLRNMLKAAIRQKNPAPLIWKFKNEYKAYRAQKLCRKLYKEPCFTTHDVVFVPQKRYIIPELNLDGDYMEAYRIMTQIVWQLKPEIKAECERILSPLKLPGSYIGLHIRGGDKITETALVSPETYVHILRKFPSFENIFVITDDFALYESLCNQMPENKFFTLCDQKEKGYYHKQFSQQGSNEKRRQMIRFLAQVDRVMQGDFFIGSITCGLSTFLHKWFWPNNLTIDCNHEAFPSIVHQPIVQRSKIAEIYLREVMHFQI